MDTYQLYIGGKFVDAERAGHRLRSSNGFIPQ